MKTQTATTELETRAAEALRALLAQFSGVRLDAIERAPQVHGRAIEIVAHVEVLGHGHSLACRVKASANHGQLRAALHDMHKSAARHAGPATPVLIAPRVSPEAQLLCKEARVGFLDFEGNARLVLGEFFIGMRSLPCRNAGQHTAASPDEPAHFPDPGDARRIAPVSAEFALTA